MFCSWHMAEQYMRRSQQSLHRFPPKATTRKDPTYTTSLHAHSKCFPSSRFWSRLLVGTTTFSPLTVLVAVTARPAAGNNILTRALALEARQGLSSLLPEACSTECTTLNTAYAGCHTGDMATCTTMCEVSRTPVLSARTCCSVIRSLISAQHADTPNLRGGSVDGRKAKRWRNV